jgi:F0F1-type ATP synthase assembly protein I
MMTDEPTATPPAGDRTNRKPNQPAAVDAPEEPEAAEAADEPPVSTPAAGTIAVLALAWLLAMLSSARRAIGDPTDANPLAVTRAALELPQVISASLIAGIAVGLVTGNLLARFARAAPTRPVPRLAVGAGAGVLTGLLVATPILLEYGRLPSILVLSGAVATAAALGGLLAGVRHRTVIAAGACGALGGFVVGLVERAFQPNLRQLFGAGDSPESVVAATGWAALTASIAAGVVAGVLGYLYLRRSGPARLRWPAYLAAGAMPGLLVLLAELVTRLGGARLFQLVSAASADDQRVLAYFHEARLNRALIVVFVGALVAIFLLGRTLRPANDED